jgi:hypothetical protein
MSFIAANAQSLQRNRNEAGRAGFAAIFLIG